MRPAQIYSKLLLLVQMGFRPSREMNPDKQTDLALVIVTFSLGCYPWENFAPGSTGKHRTAASAEPYSDTNHSSLGIQWPLNLGD